MWAQKTSGQFLSSMKTTYTTNAYAAAQAGMNSLHLPLPNALKTILATSAQPEIRPTIFQIPDAGIIPCGLPPLWNQEKKNTNSSTVEQVASISAVLPQ